jgi:dipeptidyl aminopeptidase/acylaminoacyl peptidase
MADGKRVIVDARVEGRPRRVWLIDLAGGEPKPLTDEDVLTAAPPSPDGSTLAVFDATGHSSLVSIADGKRTPLALPADDLPFQWTADGKSLYVRHTTDEHGSLIMRLDGYISARGAAPIFVYDLATGKERPWRVLTPPDPAGTTHIDNVLITPDGKSYVYSYLQTESNLYLVDGVR